MYGRFVWQRPPLLLPEKAMLSETGTCSMKKWLLFASLLGSSAAVYAQSSVTLYGRIDTGIQYQTGMPQGNLFSMETGNWDTPRFGLKGSEDIGGGTKVIF